MAADCPVTGETENPPRQMNKPKSTAVGGLRADTSLWPPEVIRAPQHETLDVHNESPEP